MILNLQTILILSSLITIVFIFLITKKVNMNLRYSIVWIAWGIIILLLSIFPKTIDYLSVILGIALPTNTLFLVFIFLLYLMSFYLFVKLSELNEKTKNLAYTLAIVSKELDEFKNKERER